MIRLHFERPSGASGSAGNDDSALASPESCESLSDAQLLETFRQYEASATAAASDRERGEAAFAELVRRHQGLVYGVCRRVLGDPHAAEDAFQATFLVLARKTHTIRDDASLPSWLHRVAFRIALRARQREGKTPDLLEDCDSLEQAERQLRDIVNRETCQAVDEELQRLPEQQRRLVLLCTLEGLSYRQAAKRLGLTRNQVKWGLSRAREALKIRLARRGFAFSLGMLTVVSLHRSAQASRPELIRRTAELAVQFKGPTALTPPTYSTAISLAHEGLHAMLLTKLKTCLLATAAAVLFVGGPLVLTSTSASPGGWFGSFAVQDEEREQEERRDRGRGDRREDDRRDERNERRDQDDRRERGERRERDERGAAEGHYRLRERDREGERRGAGEMRREGDRGPERRGDMRNRRPGQEEGRPEWMQELERARRAAAEAREVAGRLRRENEERLNQARAQERRFNEQRAEVEELRQLLEQTRRVAGAIKPRCSELCKRLKNKSEPPSRLPNVSVAKRKMNSNAFASR